MVVNRFEEQVKMYSERIAIKTVDRELSYQLLNSYANAVAKEIINIYTKSLENQKKDIVALLFEHGTDMIVSTIGALKAEKIYVPFDPSYPIKRLVYMLEDSEASVIVTNNKNLELAVALVNETKALISIFNIDEVDCSSSIENIDRKICDNDIAYILYTSGSTGKPKGVIQTYKNILHFINSYTNTLSITKEDRVTLFSAFSHDAAIMDIYSSLLNGATLYPLNIKEQVSIEELASWLQKEEITIYHSVPTVYRYFVNTLTEKGKEGFQKLRFIVLGGENVIEHDIAMFKKLFTNTRLVNLYGQTESSYNSSQIFLTNSKFEKITLGETVEETEILVVDENREEVSSLSVGEIVILSDYVALGYWKDGEKTKEVFEYSKEAGKLYWTGDLGRLLEDGSIKFVGRKGSQVKIRGYRVELGEVETQLLNHEAIKQAVVLGRKDENGGDYLSAYIVSNKLLTVAELREYLSIQLPEYMIPSNFLQLEKIPLTPNRKVDTQALIEIEGSLLVEIEYEAPRNEVEEKLVKIWSEVLKVDKVGVNDNFFNLGGHSLKATSLVSKVHKEFNVEIPLIEIFKAPTIKQMAIYIEGTVKSIYSSIEIVEDKEYYEASSAQKRMYMLQQFDLTSTGYNMPGVMIVEGCLDEERLEKSFAELIRRHETLRTSFETIEDKIVQIVNENVNFKLDRYEVISMESQEKAVDNIVNGFVKAFDLNKAPLLRVGLIKLEKDKYVLMFDMHHIISDGVSTGILTNEIAKIYEGNKLEQLRIQYKDYSQWKNSFLKSEVMIKQKEYWINRFKDEVPVLNIRTDFERPLMQSFEGENISFKLDNELTKKLKRISKETGSTMYMVLLAGVNILLSKYSGQADITVGSPIAGRPHADLEKIIGIFVNTLTMRNHPDGNKTYEEFLKEVKENALKAYENQDYQFDELIDNLSIPRDISRNPLFDVMFTMQNMDSEEIQIKDLIFKGYKQEHKVAKFDLTFSASDMVENIILNLEYCTKLYKRETIEIMIEHFVNILEAVVADTKVKLNEIEMLTEDERCKLLHEFNDTYAEYSRVQTIQELFEEQALKTPENIAVVFQGKELTYRELNEKANKLARVLRGKEVKADSIVGIMVERSFEMIIGIMAILKAGGAYLPIDPEYPVDRIGYMLEDSKTKILLTQEHLIGKVEFDGEVLNLQDESMYSETVGNLEKINTSKDLAYVIYTSGSTGNPKGVMIEHKALNNFKVGVKSRIDLSKYENILCLTTISFDIFVLETLVPLLEGIKIVIADETEQVNSLKLNEIIIKNNIEVLQITPSRLQLLMLDESFKVSIKILKIVMVGGESFPQNLLKELSNYSNIKIYNMYGPTETTVWSTIKDLTKFKEINIGKPISNTQVYITDKINRLQPIGTTGELCISGEGLARGYLNNSKLTAEKFVLNPFIEGERMYKTGDLARWLPDGNIEFLGRIDHQVKVRGFRIELGEIESQLLNHESVRESIVLDRQDENGTKYLCAYIVSEKELIVVKLREYLSRKLPEYMIPSYFVQLDKMPLTPNGKIDRKALPNPDGSILTGAEYEAPRNDAEEKLVAIWKDVLAVERVGINDNFFELGGHSLKATALVSKIHKELNVEVPLREIFKFPTIKGISKYIKITEKSIYASIEIVEEKEYYEASSAQKRMYMLQQFDLTSTGYNMPGVMVVEGELSAERIEKSFIELIRRHETLRTSFEAIEERIVQRVNGTVNFKLDCFEVGCIESTDKAVDNLVKDFVKAFDLNKAPLLRVGLIKLEEDKHILMFDTHHIISDGVSMGILTNEFAKIYEGNELEQLRIQYKDYSQWQNKMLKSEEMKNQKEYWIDRFSNEIPVLNMPIDFQRPLMQSFEGENISFKLDNKLTKDLKRISKETGSTMYMVLLSGVNILLSKYSGQEDIIIGSPIAGRPHADLEKIIGIFINTLAMRNYPEGNRTYEDFLKEVKENALKAYENQDYQFDELVDNLSIPRDISRNALFDVMFTMQNINSEEIGLKDLIFKGYKQEHKVAKFDLSFSASELEEEIVLKLQYSTKLYKRETIERMVEHFVNILQAVSADTKIKLGEIQILTEGEKHKLLFEFNDTYADYPRDKTIYELFEEQVKITPNNIAVVYEDKNLTYMELNEKSNSLARTLIEKGIKPDSIVGIMVERSLEMIVGIMGILKSGGAYLPIDPQYPQDRIRYMLQDSETNILLTQEHLLNKVDFDGVQLNIQDEKVYSDNVGNLGKMNTSKDLAYVIYTSGSTGNPKGVMVEHCSVINRLNWMQKRYPINIEDVILQKTTYTFDVSVWELIWWSLIGAKVCLLPQGGEKDLELITNTINCNKVTVVHFVPSMLNIFLDYFEKEEDVEKIRTLKQVFSSGEALSLNQVKRFNEIFYKNHGIELCNLYGPTEATVDVSYFDCSPLDNIEIVPIGKPIDNIELYILDKKTNIQPIGIPGELCIAGEGLARGYLNKPELTAEKFIESPFVSGERIYKTGDLARWMPDGNIEFFGRIDHQVKVRGFRIELGEIEGQLLNHESVKEAIVIDREDENQSKYLSAYLVSEKQLTVGELRNYLLKSLPEYMIPSYFVQLDKIPLTPNGKIDRKALPKPDGSIGTGEEYEAARNVVEEKLIKIWREVLGVERVGVSDNFFELGGHSLKATTLVSKIHKELNVEVPLREIFKVPTIKGISEYIESTEKSIYSSIEIVEEKEYYEASSAQKRMYLLQQFDLDSTGYNMPGVILVEGRLNEEKLEKSFSELIRRHETLRTSFETIEGKIIQRVNESVNFKVDRFEVDFMESQEKEVDNIVKQFVKAFDLNKAPLLRVGLIKMEEEKHILMLDMHHIISDGVSMEILTNEFAKIYEGNELEQLRIQYKDYSQWQNSLLKSDVMQKQREYWTNTFKDEIPVLNIRTDFERPLMQSFEGESISFKLDKELTKDLRMISKETGSTMYMVLLSGVNILLSKYSGQEDIIVGSPISGRPHADLLKIIGIFVNTLAMRNYPDGNRTYEDFLKEVKENALKAYENQDYQFDELVEKLSIPRDISRNPLFDVMFTMQNIDSEEIQLKDLIFKGYKQEHKVAKFDLTFSASDRVENIMLNCEYSSKLYKKETIEIMIEHLVNIFKAVAADTKVKLSEIDMLTEGEKHKLLYEFNDTYADYRADKTIHELFEEQALKTPDNIAVVFEDKKLTYRELNARANKLARTLREKGVKADSIVGIMVERSDYMIVGMIAILKSGGAYLPIDTEYPADRIRYMIEDSNTKLLLTQSNLIIGLEFHGEVIDLEDEEVYSRNGDNPEKINTTADLAYVIYTSGSTGKPKGVMIEHKSIATTLQWRREQYKLNSDDSILQLFSNAFDGFVTSFYTPIISGSQVVILSDTDAKDVFKIRESIVMHKITHFIAVPSMCLAIIENLTFEEVKSLRIITLAGESLTAKVVEKCKNLKEEIEIVNEYGPTENSVVTTIMRDIHNNKQITIGSPKANTRIYIVDKKDKLQSIGIPGEICISGEGLSRGYLNNSELTAEKFIASPFVPGERMYKTGDLARWMPDGNIEFLGRIDHQVKIRGFRIELGEIEGQLLNHESVKEAIVIDREDENESKYLCAYLVVEKELIVGELRNYLLKNLPEYMIPSYFVQLEKMPLTPNGKIDRKALPEPYGSIVTGIEYEAPRNEIEEKLVVIWKEVLTAERVGINDNFFELGGHSLKATTVVSKIYKELNVAVPLREIFKFPTIKGTSEYIGNTEKSIYSSIEIVKHKEYYEASSAQKRMYMLQQFDLDSTGYNMPGVMVVEGKLNEERLEKSFAELIRRHETLRTSFETIEDTIVQRVNEGVNFKLDYFEVGCVESTDKAVDNIVKDFVRTFDLNKAPLLRVGLIKLEEEKHILMFDMHHIVTDGVSMGILVSEFSKIYEGNELEQLRIQYKDYSQWQNILLKSDVMQEQKEYWINRLKDEIPVLNIKTDFERPLMQSFEGESISFKLDKELTKDLKKISKETGSTLYMVLLSGVNILLSKYSGQEDIIIGSTIAGRPHADLLKIIGMFVNTLAMRNHPEGSKTYEDFLKEVKENALRAYENQDYQFDELVDHLSITRDVSRNALFDVMFTMQNIDSDEVELKDLMFKGYKQDRKVAKFDLTFSASEMVENIILNFQYSTKLYKKETIERMIEHFVNILKAVTGDMKIKLSEIDMLTEDEKHKLLYEFNDTYVDYPRDKTIHELFEEQALKTPENVAAVFEYKKLTYRELNEKANKLARTLRAKGVKPDSIVAIMVENSLEMIVGIMGVLKAGGAYLPIDPQYPAERISHMIEDSNTNILLTQSKLIGNVEFHGEIIDLEDEEVCLKNGECLESINTSSDLAYVIYTSGSTGKPKGVMIEQKGLVNYVFWAKKKYLKDNESIFPLYTSFSFDLTITSIFVPLISGGKIIVYRINDENSMVIRNILEKNEVSTIKMTPAHLELIKGMENEKSAVRTLIIGGEELKTKLAAEVYQSFNGNIDIYNEYGPTEAVVGCILYKYDYRKDVMKSVLIGKPADNVKIYILDKFLKRVPENVPGEIYISGEGLARGYLNRPELTAEKFIENPFTGGERMYKTGDLARWLTDGNIEFLGRIDHQVKIRGFRIELGEIEGQLLNHKSVKEAIVLDKEDENGTKYLCAYLVSEKELTVGELRKHLSESLPEYMIPSYFVQLEKIPLTPNGKIDRKALPKPDGSILTGEEYEAPRNEVEEKLVAIWKEVLGVERVGINDNFFELGGHSLKATTLVAKIHKELSAEVPLREIFKFPTIKMTSEYIGNAEKSIHSSIEIVQGKEYYEASSAQKRMFMLQQFDLKSTGYNMPGVMLVEGRIEVERLEKSFIKLIRRHETLRTSFETIGDKIVQRVNESVNFKLDCIEIGCIESTDDIVKDFVKAFDLNKAPLLRVGLIKLEEDRHILMFDMHHIISDGVSMGILINEFAKIYEGSELEQLRIQYKDYSEWQNSLLKSEVMQKQKEYWINRFNDEIPVLNIRADFQRPLIQSFEGNSISFKLDKELTQELKQIAKETGSTTYMVLLSGINILLSKYSGQEDIIIGSPIAGRPHADLLKIIGMFVNTLAMRNHPEGSKTYEDFLKEVKENSLKAYENQDYQFDELVDELTILRDISRNPLFDVMFTMENADSGNIELKDLIFKGYKQEHNVSKFDLTFSASDMVENIILNLQYSTKLYKKETIETMLEHFVNILKAVATDTKIKLSEIDMLTEGEKHKLLYEFNDTYADYPRDKTIHELFEEQALKTPDNIAVVFEDKKLTYRELNEKANKLARVLIERGVKPDSIVGIMVERSIEMIVGIMGILKSGGAYLPIDPEYPEDRIVYMLGDSKARILLTQECLLDKVDFHGEVINMQSENAYGHNGDNLGKLNISKNLAYVIYTSGSTGNPKGVMVEQKSVISLVSNTNYISFEQDDKILQTGTLAFDASTFEIWGAVLNGLELHLGSKNMILNTESMQKYINENNITILWLTAPLFNFMAEERPAMFINLRYLLVGGDVLSTNHINKVIEECRGLKIINGYGPTENTTFSTCFLIDKEYKTNIPIGSPISNSTAYIIDKYDKLQSVGIYGQLCVGGDGLARGYLNNPELTIEKFIENPFVSGERMYKTGDLARWLPDGNIDFLGRIDNQVKIRGFRIELGEIESQLLSYEAIMEVVVIDKEDENRSKYLCAYLVSEKELTVGELRVYLSKKLPEYMIPSYFVQLDKMPLTPNGKIDRKVLPEPDGSILTGTEYEAARNEVEEKLVKIWSEVLGVEKVGINDNFFELGGHSLKATMLVGKIHKEFNVEVPLKVIFKMPTIKDISKCILNKDVFTAYKDYSESEVVMKLNDTKTKNIFLFPPILGYGITYNDFAKYVEDYTLYSFDFIEDENRIKEYVKQITTIQKEGKYVLMGYSAGGNLAFEVAKELENRGYEVEHIILLDSSVRDKEIRDDSENLKVMKGMVDGITEYARINAPFMLDYIIENVQRKFEKFTLYFNKLVNNGNVDANIHLILSSSEDIDEEIINIKLKKANEWEELTKKCFKVYQGYGDHNEMVNIDYAKLNVQILNEILMQQD